MPLRLPVSCLHRAPPPRGSQSAFQTFSREATGTEGVPLMRFSPSGQLLAVVGQRRQGRAAAGLPHADVQGEVVTLFDTMNVRGWHAHAAGVKQGMLTDRLTSPLAGPG